MEHQDWTPVIIRKRAPSNPSDPRAVRAAQRNGDAIDTVRKVSGKEREYSDLARKLEADLTASPTDAPPPQTALPHLNGELRKKMIQARVAKKLTQAQLAQQAHTQPKVINDLESGKVVTDTSVVTKVNRILGTTLRLS